MIEIQATQFVLPNGRKRTITCKVDASQESYDTMLEKGHRFELELLPIGLVHVTISDGEQDIHQALTKNGPEVQENIKKWLKEYEKN